MYFQRFFHFLAVDLWRIRIQEVSRAKSVLLRALRVLVISFRGFGEDRCALRASALTYFTLLSVVPVLAMAFGIAKGFGLEKALREKLIELGEGQQEILSRMTEFAQALLQETSGGLVAGIGVVLLFWSIIKLLGTIERSFNEIWGIQKDRPLVRKVSDYLSFMLIAPILFLAASSLNVIVSGQIEAFGERFLFLGPVAAAVGIALPYLVVWLLFTFMYLVMPNGRVSWRAALAGGILAGTLFQLLQWGYVTFQVGVARFNAIYGSFAALPLFLIWLQISWLIVLYGAEVSFAAQHADTYELEPDCQRASPSLRKLLSLAAARICVRRFQGSESPPTANEIAHELQAPSRLTQEVIHDLVEAGVLAEVLRNGEPGFQPAQCVESLTVARVLELLDRRGKSDLPYARSGEVERLTASLESLRDGAARADANLRLDAL